MQANQLTGNALIDVQRAFVFPGPIDGASIVTPQRQIALLEFTVNWENSGTPPTRNLLMHVSRQWQTSPLPDSFSYPDMWDNGVPYISTPAVIPPRGTARLGPFTIPADVIAKVQRRESIFISGDGLSTTMSFRKRGFTLQNSALNWLIFLAIRSIPIQPLAAFPFFTIATKQLL